MTGVIKNVVSDRGFAFIIPDIQGPDVFVHHSQMRGNTRLDQLFKGDRVRFSIEQTEKGPRAVEVWRE